MFSCFGFDQFNAGSWSREKSQFPYCSNMLVSVCAEKENIQIF
jgi:hypothetical protein